MICLLHSIRDRAKKEKSPRSVVASGVKFFVFNDFEQKYLKKNSTADFIEEKFCDNLPHISGGEKKVSNFE